jgi:hypothetical protein
MHGGMNCPDYNKDIRLENQTRIPDKAEYDRCIGNTSTTYDAYKQEVGSDGKRRVYGNVDYCRTSNFNVGWGLSLAPRQRWV